MTTNSVSGGPTGRRQNESSGRRSEILAVAADVFASKGYRAATVRDIADVAGILSGSLYHHFESKDAMLEELLTDYIDQLEHSYRSAIAEAGKASESLARLIEVAMRAIVDRRPVVTIMHNDFAFIRTQPRFDFVKRRSKAIEDLWLGVVQRGQQSGELRTDLDSHVVYRTIMGSVLSAVRWYEPGGAISFDQLVAETTSLFVDGLRRT